MSVNRSSFINTLERGMGSQCVAEDSRVGGFPDLSELSVEVSSVEATGVMGHGLKTSEQKLLTLLVLFTPI
jgi:hypothetical protein